MDESRNDHYNTYSSYSQGPSIRMNPSATIPLNSKQSSGDNNGNNVYINSNYNQYQQYPGTSTFSSKTPFSLPLSPLFFKRLSNFNQIDFEYAFWEMFYLCVSPQRVYRNIYYHRQTKNQWARDDPAFVILLSFILTVSAIAYGIVFKVGFFGLIRLILWMVLVDFIIVGIIISTTLWYVSNKFFLDNGNHVVSQTVEWAYSFDIHCNSFFPMCLITYILQLIFWPVVTKDRWICIFLGNTFYFIAMSYYIFITYLGYKTLPFLKNTSIFIYPIAGIAIFYLFSLLGFNITKSVLNMYFSDKLSFY